MREESSLKKLLKYLVPFRKFFFLTIILCALITAMDIVKPRIIQKAIDDNLGNNVYYEKGQGPYEIGGKYYSREKGRGGKRVFLVQREEGFYLSRDEKEITEGSPLLTEREVEEIRGDDYLGIRRLALVYLATVILGFLFSYLNVYITNKTGQGIIYKIRQDIYSHVLSLNMAYFDQNAIGRLVTRVTNDTENLNEMFTSMFQNIFTSLFQLLGIVIMMLSMNFRLSLFIFMAIPIILLIAIEFRKRIRVLYEKERSILSTINTQLSENISGMKLIQIMNKEKKVYDEFDRSNRSYRDVTREEIRLSAIFRPAVEMVQALMIAALIYFGGLRNIEGTLSFGILYAFIDYSQRFFRPIFNLTEVYNVWQSAMTSADRIFDLLAVKSPIEEKEDALAPERLEGKIEFSHVWFKYKDEWVIKDLSFTIEAGEFAAFVGPTGAGKTSIINLMARFYDIQKGNIYIDGIDIRDYDIKALRKRIGIVQQDVFLFSDSIKDNISLKDQSISDERIKKAAREVNASPFIEKLKNGYDQEVMERGRTFSAGERQLLSYARTTIRDPDILVLDEATANIDTETEDLIEDAMKKSSKNRTTIAIAHRISTIANADKIFVMNHGRLQEEGTAKELIEKDGLFKVLYDLQYKEMEMGDGES